VALQQRANVGGRWVVDADLDGGHGAKLGDHIAGDKLVSGALAVPSCGI
jgi:hypothetical protein